MAVDTAAGSLVVTRDRDNCLHAFVNACRHRGARLVEDVGACRGIVCPYHAWTYNLDGSLRAAPGMGGVLDFDPREQGLIPVRLAEWGGFLFACFDPETPALETWLGDLPERMAAHRPDDLRCVRRMPFDVAANWKFLIGNALEAYHTGSVHRDSLGAQQAEAESTRGQWDALYVHGEDDKSISTLPGGIQPLPFIEGLSARARSGTWFTVIYPCTQIVFSPDCAWWLDFQPLAADCTRLVLGACFPRSSIELADFRERAEPYFQRWSEATPEDNAIAEAQQRGHGSGRLPAGRYALSEQCVHRLDNWVLDRVLGTQAPSHAAAGSV